MPRAIRSASLTLILAAASVCSLASAQIQLPEPELKSPDELPPIPEVRELLATVNGIPIYADEMEPLPVAKNARVEEPGSEGFERWLDATRRGNLQNRVVQLIEVRVVEENAIAPTEDEINALRAFRSAMEEKRLADLTTMRDGLEIEVTQQRQNGNEPPDEVLLELRRLRQEVSLAEKAKRNRETTDPDAMRRMGIAQRRFAERTVTSWKFTKFIHDKYGGKVLMMGTNAEPIEAYLLLFEEEEQAGRLKFETEWARSAVIGAFESVRPQLVEPTGDTFARPWWDVPLPGAAPAPPPPPQPTPAPANGG